MKKLMKLGKETNKTGWHTFDRKNCHTFQIRKALYRQLQSHKINKCLVHRIDVRAALSLIPPYNETHTPINEMRGHCVLLKKSAIASIKKVPHYTPRFRAARQIIKSNKCMIRSKADAV